MSSFLDKVEPLILRLARSAFIDLYNAVSLYLN